MRNVFNMKKSEFAEHLIDEFRRTIAHADWIAAGRKGMHVPFHGDFASCVGLPSVIFMMRWWVKAYEEAEE